MLDKIEELKKDHKFSGLKVNKTSYRALIVDDAVFIRRSLTKILTTAGYEVVGEAENGEEALDKYFDLRPDIVTMDITMPIMEGIEAVEKIIAKDPSAKIIMVSAMGYQNMVKDAIIKGAKNFVVKPVKEDTIERFLEIIKRTAES